MSPNNRKEQRKLIRKERRHKGHKYFSKNWALLLAIAFILFGVTLIFIFAINIGSGVYGDATENQFNNLKSGVVGPLFSIVGFLILFQTITNQQSSFNIQQFEVKLFQLIDYHRDNVAHLELVPSSYRTERNIFGSKVFIELKKQMVSLYRIVKPIVAKYVDGEDEIRNTTLRVSYICFFYGVSSYTVDTTISVLKNDKHSKALRLEVINTLKRRKVNYKKNIVFYGGHQSKLGYYFRNIYRTLKFVEDQGFLSPTEKKDYVKLLRAQFSNYEQALMFYNSMSPLGDNMKKWILDYELIRNIPEKFLGEIEPKAYYDKIVFEYQNQ